MRARYFLLGPLLWLAAAVPAPADAQPRRVAEAPVPERLFTYQVRLSYRGETVVERDFVYAPGRRGEHWVRSWTEAPGDPCAPQDRLIHRRASVRLYSPKVFDPDSGHPPHAVQFEAELMLPPQWRAPDGSCARHPAGATVEVSQIGRLEPGASLRLETVAGLVVEIRRR